MPTALSSYAAALSAYAQAAAGAGGPPPATVAAASSGAHGSFADAVQQMLDTSVDAGKASESKAMSAIADRNDLAGVVTAVAEAEVALQSVIAIRDRAVEAYKDIMRMPI